MISQSSIQRAVVSALLILFVVSSIVPTVTIAHSAHDTDLSQSQSQMQAQLDGTIVAQQEKKSGSKNKKGENKKDKNKKVNTIIEWLKVLGVNYDDTSKKEKQQIKNSLRTLLTKDLSKKEEKKQLKKIIEPLDDSMLGSGLSGTRKELVKQTIANVFNEKIGGYAPAKPVPPSGDRKTIRALTKLAQEFEGVMVGTMPDQRAPLKKHLRKLQAGPHPKDEMKTVLRYIINDLRKISISLDKKEREKVEDILASVYGKSKVPDEQNKKFLGGIEIDMGALIDAKLKALADSFKQGAAKILTNLYNLAFDTPVPENSGWKGILGTPVDTKGNQAFYTLYQKLLVEKLYPVTYSLLSIGIVFMAISLAGNPFMSHHQVVDYFIKLILGIMYWAFAWTGVTLMHGVVNDITMWLRPSPEVMGALITNVEALAAGAVAAYFVGSGGILATLFTLAIELGIRRVLLLYVFPYIFPVLLLVLYLSPWRRLRWYASMGIWQYVNVLTMVIPMAILLKAAAVVSLGLENKSDIVAMVILVALFAIAMIIPFITTYLYIQMPGTATKATKMGLSKAYGRLGDARKKMGWGGDGSASESTATGSTSPGDRGENALVAATDASSGSGSGSDSGSGSGFSGSGTAQSTSDTTASRVRKFYKHSHSDPMSDEAMLEAYSVDNSRASPLPENRQEKNN